VRVVVHGHENVTLRSGSRRPCRNNNIMHMHMHVRMHVCACYRRHAHAQQYANGTVHAHVRLLLATGCGESDACPCAHDCDDEFGRFRASDGFVDLHPTPPMPVVIGWQSSLDASPSGVICSFCSCSPAACWVGLFGCRYQVAAAPATMRYLHAISMRSATSHARPLRCKSGSAYLRADTGILSGYHLIVIP